MAEYYAITDLGTLPGGASSNAYGINDGGQVVGSSAVTRGNAHALLWTPTTLLQDLGTLPGGSNSEAFGISVCGLVAGQSDLAGSGGKTHAFVWSSAGGMQDLGMLAGDDGSEAGAVNACSQVIGNSSLSAGGHLHAFIWSKAAGMVGLGVLPGFTDSGAHDFNNLGQVVGYCALAGVPNRGFFMESSTTLRACGQSVRCRAESAVMPLGSTIWAKSSVPPTSATSILLTLSCGTGWELCRIWAFSPAEAGVARSRSMFLEQSLGTAIVQAPGRTHLSGPQQAECGI